MRGMRATGMFFCCTAYVCCWPAAEVSVDAWYFRSLGNTGSSHSGSVRRPEPKGRLET